MVKAISWGVRGASAPPGRPKGTAPGGNLGVALRSKHCPSAVPVKQNYFPLATHKNKTIYRWPMAKRQLFSIGHEQKQNYFQLANGKNKTIFHWPMAKTKLFSVGPWQKRKLFSIGRWPFNGHQAHQPGGRRPIVGGPRGAEPPQHFHWQSNLHEQ